MQTHTQSEFIKLVYITDEVPATLAPVQLLLLFPEFDDILDNGIDEEIVSKKLKQSQNFMAFFVRTQCVSTQNSFVSLTLFFFFFVCSIRLEIYNSVWNTNGTNYARFHYSRLVWYNSSTSRTTRNSNGKLYWFHDDYTILCLDRVVKDIKHSFRNYGTKGSRF